MEFKSFKRLIQLDDVTRTHAASGGNHTKTLSARFLNNIFTLRQLKDTLQEKLVFLKANASFPQLRKVTIRQDIPSPQSLDLNIP
ncbi:hypothetical protein E2C01_049965 [Portunus trituberculatus]|uniref:Uncharacterized protein n=1 Tax=Portunus trituberculatus TaxID=210409 RepID=A0A5B7GEN4_PORTR|nr:hypothetical protein [Portunus trituberculatus]